jgi:hypothetical protein
MQYEKKAGDRLAELLKWMRENLTQAMDVTYKGVTRPLVECLGSGFRVTGYGADPNSPPATHHPPPATRNSPPISVRDLINAVASSCLSTHFAEALPDYPAFSILVTQASRAQAAGEAVRWLGGGLKTRQGTAVLDALGLLDGDKVKGRGSRYGSHFLEELSKKGEGQVLNRSELIAGTFGAEADTRFGLEPEWVAVVLLGLVYSGEIALALPGYKIDAGNLDQAIQAGVEALCNWKFIQRPKGLPLAALTALFELLGLPGGLIADANQHDAAVEQLGKRVANELDRLVLTRQKAQGGLPVWEANLLESQARVDTLHLLDDHKAFLESLQTCNTPGKLRNFRYSADEVQAQAAGRALLASLEALAEVGGAIQPLTAYLGVARAVLPADHPWSQQAASLRAELLDRLRSGFGACPERSRRITGSGLTHNSSLATHNSSLATRHSLIGALENLKSEYVEAYLALHRRARLNAAEDGRKKQLMGDGRHKQLTALAAIDFLPVADLQTWENALSGLRPCYAVGASELKEHPLCPHCGYRPVEEPAARPAYAILEEQESRLGQIHANWTNALLANLRQETTQANVALMTPDQRKLLQDFLDAGALPATVSYDFVGTIREALTDLQRVAVPPEDILIALTEGGMPCTVQELLSRFRSYVEGQIAGKDSNKVRIVIE